MEGNSNLVIVESPSKAKTIQKFLGGNFVVKSSFGHIRDLQDKKLSVDVEHGFAPEYVVPAGKKKVVSELKKAAAGADTVWLASDEDREGEAISWHLAETLGLDKSRTHRIVFHEITRNAILEAVKNPREIDLNLVNAQQARRVLDRLVGFELSPILWRKIKPGLSAGRVQSVALRLVVDREREINSFESVPSYRVEAVFRISGTDAKAVLDKRFGSLDEAHAFLQDSIGAEYSVDSISKKESLRHPAPPFTTSTLQQEAGKKLRFPVSLTMRVAQALYERGLITYMRTDSTNLSSLALGTSKKWITENFGDVYSHPRQYKTRSKGAQEAHEAIRPTFVENREIEGTAQEKKLYELIWKRTVASQMADARMLGTTIRIASDKRAEHYSMQAAQILFDGFLKVYMESPDEDSAASDEVAILPEVREGCKLEVRSVKAECKYSQPPYRYSEPTLVKKLEELGIGRPSTYAAIISTLTTGHGYILKGDKPGRKAEVTNLSLKGSVISELKGTETIGAERGKLLPQDIGMIVSDYLVENFPEIMDYDFTAKVEKNFDEIAEGGLVWNKVIAGFYGGFHNQVEEIGANRQYSNVERTVGVDPADGKTVTARYGKFGPYVQKGEGEDRHSASLAKGQLIETITLEEALELLKYPRRMAEADGKEMFLVKGRFGFYLKWGERNISIPKGIDPLGLDADRCVELVRNSADSQGSKAAIKEFAEQDIRILSGPYGPYIRKGGKNYRIPRGTDPGTLGAEDCLAIVAKAGERKTTYKKK